MAGVIPKEIANAITDYCRASEDTDAVSIAAQLMQLDTVRMHGPEHHYLTASAVLTAYCNFYQIEKKSLLVKAYVRTNIIPVGVCAMYGCCGALMGAGAAVGILLTAHPFSSEDLRKVNQITSGIQMHLSVYGGPRCCKRAVWISVYEAVQGMNQFVGCELPAVVPKCSHSAENKGCLGKKCEFFAAERDAVTQSAAKKVFDESRQKRS